MTTPHDKALLPCPFCGNAATLTVKPSDRYSTAYVCCNYADCIASETASFDGEKHEDPQGIQAASLAIAAWNRRTPIEAGNGGDGWLDISSAPKDSPIIAISWQDGYGSFESKWSKPEFYEWDEMHSYWANKQRGTCIWPKYQDRYRCKSLGRAPSPPSPSNEGSEKP